MGTGIVSDIEATTTEAAEVARLPITVVIPTLNAADRLAGALMSVVWADQVIVADGGSTDGTTTIARRFGVQILHAPGLTIGAQRNVAIAEARNHWVLALDADEEVTPELRQALATLVDQPVTASGSRAYRVRSRNWYMGRELKHGPWGRDYKVRVFARGERFSAARVHENLESLTDVGTLDGALIHHPYRDVAHQVSKIATYSRWGAEDMRAKGRTGHVSTLLTRPLGRFFRDYVVMSGWRDGTPGFVAATVSAFSVFLKYAMLLSTQESTE
jgi:glycosyltransferase involved in cell wall biosynthesis